MVGTTPKHMESSQKKSLLKSLNSTSSKQLCSQLNTSKKPNNNNTYYIQKYIAEKKIDENKISKSHTENFDVDETVTIQDFIMSYDANDEEIEDISVKASSAKSSDCGYESLASPHSVQSEYEIDDIWNQSVTELFPALL